MPNSKNNSKRKVRNRMKNKVQTNQIHEKQLSYYRLGKCISDQYISIAVSQRTQKAYGNGVICSHIDILSLFCCRLCVLTQL